MRSVYDFSRARLANVSSEFIEDIQQRGGPLQALRAKDVDIDEFVRYDRRSSGASDLKLDLARGRYAEFDEARIRDSLYRPFTKRLFFFDRILNRGGRPIPRVLSQSRSETENRLICVSGHRVGEALHGSCAARRSR